MTITATAEYAYTRREGDRGNGRYHAVIDSPITVGRFIRQKGDALCKPRREFWGLSKGGSDLVDCPRCIELAGRYVVTLPNCPRAVPGCAGGCAWECPDCGCRNCHEVFCCRCGAGPAEADGA